MSFYQAVFLAIVQGLTEFLPISSSGHLVIFQKMFRLEPPILFDVFVHVGTLLAVIVFFRKEIKNWLRGLVRRQKQDWLFLYLLFLGSLPAGLLGWFLNDQIESIFNSLKLVAYSLLFTSFLLFLTALFKNKIKKKTVGQINWKDSLLIGFFQAIAILPGVSRSGATIAAGLFRKFDQKLAFQFSFFLAIPAILGALFLQLSKINNGFALMPQSILGMIVAAVIGYFSLLILRKILIKSYFWVFGFYCFLVGIFLLIIS